MKKKNSLIEDKNKMRGGYTPVGTQTRYIPQDVSDFNHCCRENL